MNNKLEIIRNKVIDWQEAADAITAELIERDDIDEIESVKLLAQASVLTNCIHEMTNIFIGFDLGGKHE